MLKKTLSFLLRPLAGCCLVLAPRLARLRAHAWLNAGLGGRLPESAVLEGVVELHGTRRIDVGERLYAYPGQYWETRETGSIVIGEGVVLSRGVHLVAYAGLEIGAGSMIGEYASLRDANHLRGSASMRDAGHVAAPIRIGRQVWIGRGAVVLAGVSIGDGAVVGANAVVTRDVPAGAVVGGVPARALYGPGQAEATEVATPLALRVVA